MTKANFAPSRGEGVAAWKRKSLAALAAVLTAAGCSSDGHSESAAPVPTAGTEYRIDDGGRGGELATEPLACPVITPEYSNGGLTAHAEAAGEVGPSDYLGLTLEINRGDSLEPTAWFAPFDENGTARATIPALMVQDAQFSPGSHIRTSIVRAEDVPPPAQTLTAEGMPGADAMVAMIQEVARLKDIPLEDMVERFDEFPEHSVCTATTWGGDSWYTDRPEDQGPGAGDPTDNPFAALPDRRS